MLEGGRIVNFCTRPLSRSLACARNGDNVIVSLDWLDYVTSLAALALFPDRKLTNVNDVGQGACDRNLTRVIYSTGLVLTQ
jgi:hypothetical protein